MMLVLQDKMSDIETTYNSYHKPKVYFEVNKKCSEDLKKIILLKLKGKITILIKVSERMAMWNAIEIGCKYVMFSFCFVDKKQEKEKQPQKVGIENNFNYNSSWNSIIPAKTQ
jgi:hypothetical protein